MPDLKGNPFQVHQIVHLLFGIMFILPLLLVRKYVPIAESVLVSEERAIPNDTIEGLAQRRPLTIERRRANHRGWRSKWGWEMGNAHVPMTQIATVCLPEKWHREGGGVGSSQWFVAQSSCSGNQGWKY